MKRRPRNRLGKTARSGQPAAAPARHLRTGREEPDPPGSGPPPRPPPGARTPPEPRGRPPHRTHPGPRTPDPDGKGPLGPFAMSRGSLPGRPRCDTTTPRPRPLRRRRQRPCFRRPSRGPPRVPGPGPGSGLPRLVREGSSACSRAGFGARRAEAQGYERDAGPICPGPATPCDEPTGRTDRHFPAAPTRTGRSHHADATARSWDRRPARTGRRRAR